MENLGEMNDVKFQNLQKNTCIYLT